MSTDFGKVRAYYDLFDENARLESPEGQLEFARAKELLRRHLPTSGRVLDLGSGPGRYAEFIAGLGHRVVLADVSQSSLDLARSRMARADLASQVDGYDVTNSTDLPYQRDEFDAVVAFGPFYHLLGEQERQSAADEIRRVTRGSGTVLAAFIPRISGLVGLMHRAAKDGSQVPAATLRKVAETGAFRNESDHGFQEGYYSHPDECVELFQSAGFETVEVISLRSIADGRSDLLSGLSDEFREAALSIAADWSRDPSVVATSGHAVYVGK